MARRAEPGPSPRRTCIGCRRVREVDDLVRITRLADGTLAVGRTLPGRGAWLCRTPPDCLELAARQGGFARAFRAVVTAERVDALRVDLIDRARRSGADFVPGTPAARD